MERSGNSGLIFQHLQPSGAQQHLLPIVSHVFPVAGISLPVHTVPSSPLHPLTLPAWPLRIFHFAKCIQLSHMSCPRRLEAPWGLEMGWLVSHSSHTQHSAWLVVSLLCFCILNQLIKASRSPSKNKQPNNPNNSVAEMFSKILAAPKALNV